MATTTRKQLNFRVSDETQQILDAIKDRDGTPYSVQLERGLRLLAAERKIELPKPPKR